MTDLEYLQSVRDAIGAVYKACQSWRKDDLHTTLILQGSSLEVANQHQDKLAAHMEATQEKLRALSAIVSPRLVELVRANGGPDPESWGVPLRDWAGKFFPFERDYLAIVDNLREYWRYINALCDFMAKESPVVPKRPPAAWNAISEVLKDGIKRGGEAIAAQTGHKYNSKFRSHLAAMVKADELGNDDDGYFVKRKPRKNQENSVTVTIR